MFVYFDRDKSGLIDFDELLRSLRGDMNERRLGLVELAYKAVDRNGDGYVTVDDLLDVYDTQWHAGVQSGLVTKEQAIKEFLSQWDRIDKDGIVTKEEFIDYYQVGATSLPPMQ